MNKSKPLAPSIAARREFVFLLLAGIFLGTMTMLNILGISRFIKLFEYTVTLENGFQWNIPFTIAVGVLPYPVTFLCTDLICELYGKRRANWVVWVGLILNLWVVFILWLAGALPGFEEYVDGELPNSSPYYPFFEIRRMAFMAVFASMIAYMAAQFCDVYLFHFWKKLTGGKHLWLRNNGSTMISQMVDSVAVILITYYTVGGLPINDAVPIWTQLLVFIGTSYAVKLVFALLDTIPFYFLVYRLRDFLQLHEDPELSPGFDESNAG